MEQLKELLFQLCGAVGTPGDEQFAAQCAKKALEPYCTDVTIDHMGNVIGFMGDKNAERQVMLDAHIDQIGMIVTQIDEDGFLHVAPCGGVDRRVLPGAPVTVYGHEILTGIVCCLPPHLVEDDGNKVEPVDKMAVDLGLTKEEAEQKVSLGDRIIINGEPRTLLNHRVSSAALDDRAGCVALIRCAQLLYDKPLKCGLTILLSTREETGSQGAKTGAFRIFPTEAIAVDVSFADQPRVGAYKCGTLGAGPMIGVSPTLDREMKDKLVHIAKDEEIPYQMEVMGGSTGTNADAIGTTQSGVRTALISIPLRYMHTPVEVVDLEDIERVAKLMASYIHHR